MSHGRSDAIAALKACSKSKDLCRGRQIHADLAGDGTLPDDVHLGSILVNMYAKCGDVRKAQEVFDELPARDVVSWTSLIGGYASAHGLEEEALRGFELMRREGFVPDPIAFVYALKACGSLGVLGEGQALQAEIAR
jgi:pentatricopeptide repeat protein